jgi:chromosomal replication initiation ATPase DnaA
MTSDRTYAILTEKFNKLFSDRPNVLQDINSVLTETLLHRKDLMYSNIDELIDSVCQVTDFTKEKLFSKSRKRHVLESRQFLIYKVKEIFGTRYTLKEIGKKVGNRDHTTIMHSLQSCRNKIYTKDEFVTDILIRWEQFTENKFAD